MFHTFIIRNRNNGTEFELTAIGATAADAELRLRTYNLADTDLVNKWELIHIS